ncbi:hypothetical protein HYH03_014359 [Edaphochlamys debaryana]|uniref:O-fucosyltransferase family protein n=1 Tax=Edaphochlamys debaryana TaxID=47281 RepID=A0A836BSC2_9CHLO|nr:hypothetical protein HYH03_014359 [Edaphochlamys debaryana]|eukprot:KAG2486987.1 hypothetical protein HYH03_014359 [Edaphochlamys debaryana]
MTSIRISAFALTWLVACSALLVVDATSNGVLRPSQDYASAPLALRHSLREAESNPAASFLVWLRRALAPGARAALPEELEAPRRIPVLKGGYLFPVLAWGPNNQVAGLKEALVLGRLLERTVVVHDILNHYDEAKKGGSAGSMDFKLVYDFDHLSRHQSVVTLDERRAAGWGGEVDAVAHFGKAFLSQIKNAHKLNVSDEGAPYIDFVKFDCTRSQLSHMAQELLPYKDVAFIVYENVVRDAGHGVKLRVTGELCHDQYLQVSAQLVKSSRILDISRRFRAKRLGGEDVPYIAVHLRPYPDTCLYWWNQKEYDEAKAKKACKNGKLYPVCVSQTALQMKRLEERVGKGKAKLFVMSYPELRPVISRMYDSVDLDPVYYDEADLEKEMGYRSISLLGMVEEEIAYEADVFIGTSYSSMTGVILQERFARGEPTTLPHLHAHQQLADRRTAALHRKPAVCRGVGCSRVKRAEGRHRGRR